MLEDEFVPDSSREAYRPIEDIAGVDYKRPMYLCGLYIGLNLFFKEWAVLGFFGILLSTTLVAFIWWYFKKYFDHMNDQLTAKWIQWLMGAHILFGVVNLFSYIYSSALSLPTNSGSDIAQGVGFMAIGILSSIIVVFLASFNLIQAGKRHPFPMKRIAISTMIFVPLYMLISLMENMPFLKEVAMLFGEETFKTSFLLNAILMLPFFFLLQHFYKADKYDAI
ncbi:MAG: hypothetical protein AAF990_14085 [Bacteroidota bacterium]